MLDLIEQHRGQISAVCNRFQVKRLELFGSAARGDFDPTRSDLDFFVEFISYESPTIVEQWFGLQEALQKLLGCKQERPFRSTRLAHMRTILRLNPATFVFLLLCLNRLATGDPNQPALPHAAGAILSYPLPSSVPASSDFHITANGTAVPVEHYRDRHVAAFCADGEIALKIRINAPITSYSIHPTSFGLKGTVDGDTLAVSLTSTLFNPQPAYLLFKIDDLENLVVLIDPPDEHAPSPRDAGVLDVSSPPYSADASGKILATTAIQSAIDKASQSSGTVYLPAGLYRVQSLSLKSGVTLYLAGGAIIQGSDSLADFAKDPVAQADGGKHLPAVIEVHDFKNVSIRGRGWVDAAEQTLYSADGVAHDVEPRGAHHRVAIRVADGSGVTVDGIAAQDGAGWSLLLNRVDNVQITRLKLLGPMWRGNDGIDICCQNAVIDKCFVYTGDDNFCTKALHPNYPVHDIHFRNSIGLGNSGGVIDGMEVLSPQSDIHFDNIDMLHAGRGLVVENRGNQANGGCSMQNIFFTDIRVEEVSGTGGTSRNPIQILGELPGGISNIFFKRVSIANFGPKPSLISGFDANNPVTSVVFEDVTIGGKRIDSISAGEFKTKDASGIKFVPSPAGAGAGGSNGLKKD